MHGLLESQSGLSEQFYEGTTVHCVTGGMLFRGAIAGLGLFLGIASVVDSKCYILMPKQFYENQQDVSGVYTVNSRAARCLRYGILFPIIMRALAESH